MQKNPLGNQRGLFYSEMKREQISAGAAQCFSKMKWSISLHAGVIHRRSILIF